MTRLSKIVFRLAETYEPFERFLRSSARKFPVHETLKDEMHKRRIVWYELLRGYVPDYERELLLFFVSDAIENTDWREVATNLKARNR